MEFKITLKNQFKALEFCLSIFLFCTGCFIYFNLTDPLFPVRYFVWAFVVQFIPVLFLHIEYLSYNSNSLLLINNDFSNLKFKREGITVNLDFNEITKIVLCLPPSSYRGRIERKMQFLPIESYGYAVIHSKNDERVVITSLMVPDLYYEFLKFKGIHVEKKKRIIASPFIEKLFLWINRDGI